MNIQMFCWRNISGKSKSITICGDGDGNDSYYPLNYISIVKPYFRFLWRYSIIIKINQNDKFIYNETTTYSKMTKPAS